MTDYISKRAVVNGVNLYYIVAGEGPVALGMHGWPQSHREFLPLIGKLAGQYRFIVPDLRGFAYSDKLNLYGYIPQTPELTWEKPKVPMLAWAGVRSFGSHRIDGAKAISISAEGAVIEECGHTEQAHR